MQPYVVGELTQLRVRGTAYTKLPHRAIALRTLLPARLAPGIGIANIRRTWQFQPCQSRHPADVGLHNKIADIPSGQIYEIQAVGSPMADHPHPPAHTKPTLAHHWNSNKYQGNLVAGAQMLKQGHVGFGSSVRTGWFDPNFWKVEGSTSENGRYQYLELIHGKKPAEAIDAMFGNPGIWSFDCAEFVQAVELFAIRNTVPTDVFNAHFENLIFRQHGSTGLSPMLGIKHSWEFDEEGAIRTAEGKTMVHDFLNRRFKESPMGSEVTFKNIDPLAKGRIYESENTIKLGLNSFIAHGIGGDGIVTREQIEDAMAKDALRRVGSDLYILTNIRINAIVEFNLH